MRHVTVGLVALALALALGGRAWSEEVEIPEFKGWAAWKEGASTTMKSEGMANGMKSTTTIKAVLHKVAADKITLEVTTVSEAAGMKFELPSARVDIPAKGPKFPSKEQAKGRETLKVNGKSVACDWVETLSNENLVTRTWYSKDVPGGTVKSLSRSGDMTVESLITEWQGTKR